MRPEIRRKQAEPPLHPLPTTPQASSDHPHPPAQRMKALCSSLIKIYQNPWDFNRNDLPYIWARTGRLTTWFSYGTRGRFMDPPQRERFAGYVRGGSTAPEPQLVIRSYSSNVTQPKRHLFLGSTVGSQGWAPGVTSSLQGYLLAPRTGGSWGRAASGTLDRNC